MLIVKAVQESFKLIAQFAKKIIKLILQLKFVNVVQL